MVIVPLLFAAMPKPNPATRATRTHGYVLMAVSADSALRLESLLGEHSTLAADMMRGRMRGDADFVQAANSALGRNTEAMAQLVGSLFGDPAAKQFSSTWAAHVVALSSYARGLADQDDRVRDQARTTLSTFENDIAGFFTDASRGRLTRDAAQAAVLAHVDHLLHQADKYAAGDYAAADRDYRTGYAHTYGLGGTLARALLAPAEAAALDAPTWRLRSELGRLLGEHVVLIVGATRAGLRDSADFTAAGDAINANTRELTGAVATLFGAQAAGSFQSLWADHIEQIMAYTAAVAGNDDKRREDARRRLNDFENRLAAFLNGATQQRLDSATLAKALAMHDQMLLQHADAFTAKDYQKAHDITDTTYAHMFDLAGQLADAFGTTVAKRLPIGGAETGHGGMAGVLGQR